MCKKAQILKSTYLKKIIASNSKRYKLRYDVPSNLREAVNKLEPIKGGSQIFGQPVGNAKEKSAVSVNTRSNAFPNIPYI